MHSKGRERITFPKPIVAAGTQVLPCITPPIFKNQPWSLLFSTSSVHQTSWRSPDYPYPPWTLLGVIWTSKIKQGVSIVNMDNQGLWPPGARIRMVIYLVPSWYIAQGCTDIGKILMKMETGVKIANVHLYVPCLKWKWIPWIALMFSCRNSNGFSTHHSPRPPHPCLSPTSCLGFLQC